MANFVPKLSTKVGTGVLSLERIFEDYLNKLAEFEINKETTDINVGKQYIKENRSEANLENIKENIDKFGTDSLISLITLAEEENFHENVLLDLLFQSSYVEPTSGEGRENFIFSVKIPKRKEIDVHLAGTINGKQVNDVYQTLYDAIDNRETIENIQTYNVDDLTFEHDGTVTLDIPQPSFWGVYVNQRKFKGLLLKQLKIDEKELQDITQISNIS